MISQENRSLQSGVTFRPFRGESDYGPTYTLQASCAIADQVDPKSMRESLPTEASIREAFSSIQPEDPDIVMVEAEDHLIGMARILSWEEANNLHVYLHLCWLLPAYRGKGIGSAMLGQCQTRIRTLASKLAATDHAVYATNTTSTQTAANALLHAEGYQIVRQLSDLQLSPIGDLPTVALPPGLIKRPLATDHYRAIYQTYKATWRGTLFETPETEEDFHEFVEDNTAHSNFDPTLWQIAWDGDEAAGLVIFEIRDGTGYMPEVAVAPQWRRKGIARSLVIDGLRTLQARQIEDVRTFTDAADGFGARSLYESVGFRETKQHLLWRKPVDK